MVTIEDLKNLVPGSIYTIKVIDHEDVGPENSGKSILGTFIKLQELDNYHGKDHVERYTVIIENSVGKYGFHGWLIDSITPVVPGGEAKTRRGDPDTSRRAAASVGELTRAQEAVMAVMRTLSGARTDEELISDYGRWRTHLQLPRQSESGLRSRRSELSRAGMLVQGEKKRLKTGRMGRSWKVQ